MCSRVRIPLMDFFTFWDLFWTRLRIRKSIINTLKLAWNVTNCKKSKKWSNIVLGTTILKKYWIYSWAPNWPTLNPWSFCVIKITTWRKWLDTCGRIHSPLISKSTPLKSTNKMRESFWELLWIWELRKTTSNNFSLRLGQIAKLIR